MVCHFQHCNHITYFPSHSTPWAQVKGGGIASPPFVRSTPYVYPSPTVHSHSLHDYDNNNINKRNNVKKNKRKRKHSTTSTGDSTGITGGRGKGEEGESTHDASRGYNHKESSSSRGPFMTRETQLSFLVDLLLHSSSCKAGMYSYCFVFLSCVFFIVLYSYSMCIPI